MTDPVFFFSLSSSLSGRHGRSNSDLVCIRGTYINLTYMGASCADDLLDMPMLVYLSMVHTYFDDFPSDLAFFSLLALCAAILFFFMRGNITYN
jgi:hypothetical protein